MRAGGIGGFAAVRVEREIFQKKGKTGRNANCKVCVNKCSFALTFYAFCGIIWGSEKKSNFHFKFIYEQMF